MCLEVSVPLLLRLLVVLVLLLYIIVVVALFECTHCFSLEET